MHRDFAPAESRLSRTTPRTSREVLFLLFLSMMTGVQAAEPAKRVLPPPGIELKDEQRNALFDRLREVVRSAQPYLDHPHIADLAIHTKAVDLALRHGEFYSPKDADKALRILKLAEERTQQLRQKASPWTRQTGRVVRGFTSRVDGSPQPYGLVIPPEHDFDKPCPLYVWLHGRGDNQTDLHFITERLDKDGQIQPAGAIVLHPFGRHCLGFKSAGETDVLEAIEHVQSEYRIDPRRIVLIGFSMGGAGAWHLGAHYTDRFVAISPGAGFAETARYVNLTKDKYPPSYEQTLWSVYDVPNYVRNLFNRPTIAYSGELDKQIQAARVMEEAYRSQGRELPHLIGPGMGHKYHPDTLKELLKKLAAEVERGKPERSPSVSLQTQTLRYNRVDWVEAIGLEQHWQDSRIDATLGEDRQIALTTRNVTALQLNPWNDMSGVQVILDGQPLFVPENAGPVVRFARENGRWQWSPAASVPAKLLAKRHGLQGPIDDAFLDPFLVVLPSGRDPNGMVEAWVQAELHHFRERWRATFRGEPRVKQDTEVTPEDMARYHLVAWGTPQSNLVLQKAFTTSAGNPPAVWHSGELKIGKQTWDAKKFVPVLIYPNPLSPQRYLVVNSGPTFREAHDKTNSQQNPKLPDWAVIDLATPPNDSAPGRIADAGFYDERWHPK